MPPGTTVLRRATAVLCGNSYANLRRLGGYERLHILLIREGWQVGRKRVHRLYKLEGLQVRREPGAGSASACIEGPVPTATAGGQYWAMDFSMVRSA